MAPTVARLALVRGTRRSLPEVRSTESTDTFKGPAFPNTGMGELLQTSWEKESPAGSGRGAAGVRVVQLQVVVVAVVAATTAASAARKRGCILKSSC
jgi:hypothetical protein